MPNTSPLDIPALLRRIPLFSELSEADIQLVTRYTRERQVARGEVLFQRGDLPHGFYFVVSGQVKLAFSSQGTEKVVEIIGPMQSFGEAVMFMNHPTRFRRGPERDRAGARRPGGGQRTHRPGLHLRTQAARRHGDPPARADPGRRDLLAAIEHPARDRLPACRWPTTTRPARRPADQQQVIASPQPDARDPVAHLPRPQRRRPDHRAGKRCACTTPSGCRAKRLSALRRRLRIRSCAHFSTTGTPGCAASTLLQPSSRSTASTKAAEAADLPWTTKVPRRLAEAAQPVEQRGLVGVGGQSADGVDARAPGCARRTA